MADPTFTDRDPPSAAPATHRIVYVVHGDVAYHDQAVFSVCTLLALIEDRQCRDLLIHVYTDQPQRMPMHAQIRCWPLQHADLRAWRGPLDYVHRIKLAVLQRAETDLGLPFIYVDCDTRWRDLPLEAFRTLEASPAQPPVCFMHAREELAQAGPGSSAHFPLLVRHRSQLADRGLREMPPWEIWNAGTIGLPQAAAGFFAAALELNDVLLPPARVRTTIEQLAVSLVATSRYSMQAFDQYLDHDWRFGQEWPYLLAKFFAGLPQPLDTASLIECCRRLPVSEGVLLEVRRQPEFRRHLRRYRRRRSLQKRRAAMRQLWDRLRAMVVSRAPPG